MKQNINLYKIANLYITLLLPLKKIIKGNAFCSKEAGKIFRNKRNASAQQKKWEISGIYFRCSGMLVLTTTIQIKMLICSRSSIFKKTSLGFFLKKRKKFLAFCEKPKIIRVKCIWYCWRNTIQTCSTWTAHCYNSDNVQQAQAQLLTVPTSQGIQSQQLFLFP